MNPAKMNSAIYLHAIILIVTLQWSFMTQGSVYADQTGEQQSCAELLPKEVKEIIVNKYKNWRILQKKDLVSDDQMLWDKYHRGECPGVTTGNFDSSSKTGYAILIISQAKTIKRTKLLLLIMGDSGKYTSQVLYVENDVSNFPVIHKEPPGKYSDFYDPKKTEEAKADVIVYEYIEASAVAFYYKNGQFRHLLISD
jgi:hypothetical protein